MKSSKGARLIRFVQVAAISSVMVLLCWAAYKTVVYVRTAPVFQVQKLSVSGLKRVQESQVLASAGFGLGVNIFRIDLDEIRMRVEDLDWIRYVSVRRVLPDEIIIQAVEREPVGMARIQGEIYEFDEDARILEPDAASSSAFPILDGLRAGDRDGNLRKVGIYRKVLQDLGQTALSEIHINDADDVAVVSASDPVLVDLGRTDFQNRWVRYLKLKPQIQAQYPEAVRVDLRFRNQIIVRMKDDETSESVVWAGKKNTL